MNQIMTKDERAEISRVIRNNEKVAIEGAKHRSAQLKAEFERQIGACYPEHHPAWTAATETGEQAIEDANKVIAAECKRLGIIEKFAPRLWRNGGPSSSPASAFARSAQKK